MGTFTNSEDPDEMPLQYLYNIFLKNITCYNGLSQVYVSNQKEECISIRRRQSEMQALIKPYNLPQKLQVLV